MFLMMVEVKVQFLEPRIRTNVYQYPWLSLSDESKPTPSKDVPLYNG